MHKRNYQLIAATISKTRKRYSDPKRIEVIDAVTISLADELKKDNERFDASTFMFAAGVNSRDWSSPR